MRIASLELLIEEQQAGLLIPDGSGTRLLLKSSPCSIVAGCQSIND